MSNRDPFEKLTEEASDCVVTVLFNHSDEEAEN